MDFKVVALDSFKIVGKKANFSTVNGENFQEIPKMWEAANASGLDGELAKVSNGQIEGILGVCKSTMEQPTNMDYWIAVTADGDYDEYESEVIPASNWAVFELIGPMPETMQKGFECIFTEVLPKGEIKMSGAFQLEVYTDEDPLAEDLHSQIWIMIE